MRMDQPDEGEMAKVIDPELQLEALSGQRARRDHNAGIVDQPINARAGERRTRRRFHLIDIGEVEREEGQPGARYVGAYPLHRRFDTRGATAGEEIGRATV